MRPLSRILFGVLLALCWSGLATADPHDPSQSLDVSAFRAVTNMQLDAAFERFVSRGGGQSLRGLAGPSSMECTNPAMHGGIETCVVRSSSPATSTIPAALAQH